MRVFVAKKPNTQSVIAVMLAILVALFAIGSPLVVYAVRSTSNMPTIVIDAGHGGIDAGVIGKTTGAKESELNLKIAFLLGDLLKGLGFFVVYTRTNDTMLTLVKSDTRKRSDMFSRGKIINSVRADVVVSVHMNYFPSEVRRGAQVFFERKDEKSFELAKCVQDMLNVINIDKTNREYSPLTADKYILSCSSAASIIVECGFLSNPLDEKLLLDATYQAHLAEKIAQGICAYLGSN